MEGFDLDPDYLVKEVFRDNDSLIVLTTPNLQLLPLEASSVEEPIRKKSKMDENNFYQSIMMATKTPSRQPSLVTPIEPRGSSSVDETDDFSTDSQSSNSSADDSDDTALKGEQGEKQESTSEEDGRSSESEDSEDNKSVALEDTVATLTDPEYSSSDNEGEESEEEEGVIVETVVSSSGKLLDMSERYPQDDSTDLSEEDSESTSSSSPESEDELSNAVPSVQSLTLEKVKPHIVVRKRTPSPTLSDHTNLPESRHVVFERPATRSSARTNLLQPTPVSFKAPLASIPDEKENTIKKKTSYTSALFK